MCIYRETNPLFHLLTSWKADCIIIAHFLILLRSTVASIKPQSDDAEIIVQEDYETVIAMLDQTYINELKIVKKVATPRKPNDITIRPEPKPVKSGY